MGGVGVVGLWVRPSGPAPRQGRRAIKKFPFIGQTVVKSAISLSTIGYSPRLYSVGGTQDEFRLNMKYIIFLLIGLGSKCLFNIFAPAIKIWRTYGEQKIIYVKIQVLQFFAK